MSLVLLFYYPDLVILITNCDLNYTPKSVGEGNPISLHKG